MKLQTAKGVQDFSPEEKIVRNEIVDILKETFERYGYLPLETPILERYETLAAKYAAGAGSDVMREIFKLKDQGKRKLGLRYDLTVPLARFVGTNPQLRMPFKRYEIGRVFRDGPIKLGRRREFWQCDVDTIGSKSMMVEAELLALADEVFKKIGLRVVIKVNNRKLLNGILEESGVKSKEKAIVSIDKLDKMPEDQVGRELKNKGLMPQEIKKLMELIKINNLGKLKNLIKNKEGQEGIKELEELAGYLRKLGVKVEFDASLARGLAYYTATVFEVFMCKGKFTGSLAAGGRWDKMIGRFLGRGEHPAVGLAFGLEPITEVLKKEGKKTLVEVFVIPIKVDALDIVKQLRDDGLKTDMDLIGRGVGKNLEYASALGIPYVVFVGEQEKKAGKVKLRNMETGDEVMLKVSEVVKKVK